MHKSIAMLKDAVAGKTYDAIAAEHGITRTAVERRVKNMARTINRDVGIAGLNRNGVGFVQRLRKAGPAVLAAIARYSPIVARDPRSGGVLTDKEIEFAVNRTRARGTSPRRDVALFYALLVTGARPLEIARMEVRDYLSEDGSVREESSMRKEVAINGNARPLFFASQKAIASIDDYLAERVRQGFGTGAPACYRGLDPDSRLFLGENGSPFEIVRYGEPGQARFLCRGILEVYRRIFRHIDLDGLSALTLRRTVAFRMHERGAAENQIGELLGISEMTSVREMLSDARRPLRVLVRELV